MSRRGKSRKAECGDRGPASKRSEREVANVLTILDDIQKETTPNKQRKVSVCAK